MKPTLRWLISLGLLGLLLLWLEPGRILDQVEHLEFQWLLLALAITAAQTALSAARWRFTAQRLGLELAWNKALGDYYLALFINQTLPGGVLGDALRAERHARLAGQRGAAWRAVLIERGSGQIIVALFSLVAVGLLPAMQIPPAAIAANSLTAIGLSFLSVLVVGIALLSWLRARWIFQWQILKADCQRALLAWPAWPRQLASSLLVVASYALVFALSALAIGVDLDFVWLLLIALPVLLAMLIPFSVAGWGWREAAAGGLWLSLGQAPEQGVAVSLTYGLVVLLGALPGALVALRTLPSKQTSTTSSPPSS